MRRFRYFGLTVLLLFSLLLAGRGNAVTLPTMAGTPGINHTDSAAMVWVPGGTFTMGTAVNAGEYDEHPAHQVTLSGYWIYKYDVTVAQYRVFCTATGHALPPWPGQIYSWAGKSGWDDAALQQHPIVDVTWADAQAYAAWARVSLPTEAQWEYAAVGPQGNNYPWGGTATSTSAQNGKDESKFACGYNSSCQRISTWPVGSFPAGASWCGALDLAGNVGQWCTDWYGDYSAAPVTNPTGPASGTYRAVRGSSWRSYSGGAARCANRDLSFGTDGWGSVVGFRCVSVSPGR